MSARDETIRLIMLLRERKRRADAKRVFLYHRAQRAQTVPIQEPYLTSDAPTSFFLPHNGR